MFRAPDDDDEGHDRLLTDETHKASTERTAPMAPSRCAPVSFDLHAVRVGSFVVQAGALLDVPLARDPCLRVDVGRKRASVEMSLPATRGHRRVSHRLARLEYGDETVEWFEPAARLLDPAIAEANGRALVLRLARPPRRTAGRVDVPEASDAATTRASGDETEQDETRVAPTSATSVTSSSRRRRRVKPFVTWGTTGMATDFTGGACERTDATLLWFRTPACAAGAAAALARAWPGKLKNKKNDARDAPAVARAADHRGARTDAASWLGKRARPDGRAHQPPRKRRAVGGPDDPGFER